MKGFWIIQHSMVKVTIQTLNTQTREGFFFMVRDQNLSSNIYFHTVNVNILFCLQDKWVRYSHCTNQGQTTLQGFIWQSNTEGLICASLEIHNQSGDCRNS